MNFTRTLPRCPPGHYFSDRPPPGKVSERGWCYKCSANTYSDELNRYTQCKSCTVCSQEMGMVEHRSCRPTADTLCRCHDQYVMGHFRCQLTAEPITRRTTFEAIRKLLPEISESEQNSRDVPATVPPEKGIKADFINDSASADSAKNTDPKAMERAIEAYGSRWIHHGHEARHVEATSVIGVTIQIDAENVAFYLGSIPVTTSVLTMGIISLISIVALTFVAVILCIKRGRRNNGSKRQSLEVSMDREYHVYEDPDTLIAEILPPLCIRVAAVAPDSPECALQSLQHPSSHNASENFFTPLIVHQMSAGAEPPEYGEAEPPAYSDIEHVTASNREENNLPICDQARTIASANGSATHVFRKTFFATKMSGSADGTASPSAAAADIKTFGSIEEATATCIRGSASCEIRVEGGGIYRSNCDCKTNAEAIIAEGLRDGGYIYSRVWRQL